jgi:hypothetical protein
MNGKRVEVARIVLIAVTALLVIAAVIIMVMYATRDKDSTPEITTEVSRTTAATAYEPSTEVQEAVDKAVGAYIAKHYVPISTNGISVSYKVTYSSSTSVRVRITSDGKEEIINFEYNGTEWTAEQSAQLTLPENDNDITADDDDEILEDEPEDEPQG